MTYFFDTIIILFLIVDALLVFNLVHQLLHWKINNTSKLKIVITSIFLFFVVICGALVFYGSYIEPQRIIVTHKNLNIRDGEKKLRIAFVADFHAGSYITKSFIQRVARKIQNQNPDIVLVGGDFVAFGSTDKADYLAPIGRINARLGVHGVLGNHDYGPEAEVLERDLNNLGIDILKNESVLVEDGESKLAITGIDDLWFGNIDFDAAEAGLREEIPKILVEHNPDIMFGLQGHKYEAVLSGHTHGGQIRLPWIGPLTSVPTALDKSYARGEFDFNDTKLFVTEGVGVTGPRARLFAPPEVMIIDVNF